MTYWVGLVGCGGVGGLGQLAVVVVGCGAEKGGGERLLLTKGCTAGRGVCRRQRGATLTHQRHGGSDVGEQALGGQSRHHAQPAH